MSSPNLLFLLVDCLRSDAILGEGRKTATPNLDALVRRGTAFTRAFSVAGNTHVCLASLVTGVYPFRHGIRPVSINRFRLSVGKMNPAYPTLAEILRNQGYETAASVTGPALHTTGFDRGFARYRYREERDVYLREGLTERLLGEMKELRACGKPWFFFVHLWEIHAPRQVAPPFNSRRFGGNRYERAVSSLDADLKPLLDAVDPRDTLVVLHGDHGEGTQSLFEFLLHPRIHDRIGIRVSRLFYSLFFKWIHSFRALQSSHGLNLYDYMVRVPVVFAGPGPVPAGAAVPDLVSQVDLQPTLLDLLGIGGNGRPAVDGRPLRPLLEGKSLPERPVYLEAYSGRSVSRGLLPWRRVHGETFDRPPPLVGIRTSDWKCIWAPEDPRIPTELYRLPEDPGERTNLAARRPEVASEMKAHLERMMAEGTAPVPEAEMSREEQEEMAERLRKLGYI